MLFLCFDHPLIEAWLDAWAQLHREDPAPPNDRPLERLEAPMVEALPDVAGESIERAAVGHN